MKILQSLMLMVAAALVLLMANACGGKKKCYLLGNGDTFNLMLFNQDGTQISDFGARDITFYYKKQVAEQTL